MTGFMYEGGTNSDKNSRLSGQKSEQLSSPFLEHILKSYVTERNIQCSSLNDCLFNFGDA